MSQTPLILVFVLLIALRVVVTRRLTASVMNKDERIQWFVGLAPHRELRVYEGAYMWDAGYLEICHGELRYVGEQTHSSRAQTRCGAFNWFPGRRVGGKRK